MKTLFLVNSESGAQLGRALLSEITKLREEYSPDLEAIEIDWEHIDQQLDSLSHYQLIVLAGGDGTVSSLSTRVLNLCEQLAIYPLGTGNDLAIELGFSECWRAGLKDGLQLLRSRPTRYLSTWNIIDGLTARSLFTFVNYASLGFSAEVVRYFALHR